MKIYRIAHKTGINEGLYRSEYACGMQLFDDTSGNERHPTPLNDSGLCEAWEWILYEDMKSDWLFGFTNLDQLKSWFYQDRWMKALEYYGFLIYEVETEHVHKGNTQCIFDRVEEYTITRKLKPTEV